MNNIEIEFAERTPSPCPRYRPASQISPDSVDELPSQTQDVLTQNTGTILFGKGGVSKERDYYEQLFSSDSDSDTISSDTSVNYVEHIPVPFQANAHIGLGDHLQGNKTNIDSESFSTSSIIEDMADDESSLNSLSSWSSSSINSGNIPSIFHSAPEEDIDYLLGMNDHTNEMPVEKTRTPVMQPDKIATYNVQNKYDHFLAAEFFIKEDLSFLAIQEPFNNHSKDAKAWKAFRQVELESARISSFETSYQVILYDTWKWGGMILSNFESDLQGRVTAIAFEFNKTQRVGFISVYASSAEVHGRAKQKNDNGDISELGVTKAVRKILQRWNDLFPDMCIIVLGDFQETVTPLDRDNIGNFRMKSINGGLMELLEDSHRSFLRDSIPHPEPYVTRFGLEGARGIDHIMVPQDNKLSSNFGNGLISRKNGAVYLPSDHAYLQCTFQREGLNNNEDGISKSKYDYSRISKIKVKKRITDEGSTIFRLDESQFKSSRKFIDQKNLYTKLQNVTADTADLSNYHLDFLEKRVRNLYKKFWKEGLRQHVNGPENELVKISEEHACELSFILKKYQTAIKEVMLKLNLEKTEDCVGKAGKIRGNLRKGKGFRIFQNLPIPTKLRYLRSELKLKKRILDQYQNLIKEAILLDKKCENKEKTGISEFVKEWRLFMKNDHIFKKAKVIYDNLSIEHEEREIHIASILHMKKCGSSKHRNTENAGPSVNRIQPNSLPGISKADTEEVNNWLTHVHCNQLFGSKKSAEKFSFLVSQDLLRFSSFVDDIDPLNPIPQKPDDIRQHQDKLLKATNCLNSIISQISSLQCYYKQSTLEYFLDTSNINSFTRKVLPKERSAPTTHTLIWDEELLDYRQCRSEVEELKATSDFHGKWMGNSKAKETCAFAKLVTEGRLGIRGVKLMPARIITEKDIPNLIHNGDKLPKHIKKSFIKAHGSHIRKLFKPGKVKREFFYPFYLENEEGKMHAEELLEQMYWNAIEKVPSKARYEGYHMAVIGRFGGRWQNLLLQILKLTLLLRYIPPDLKRIARYPIPKPGKINEYRPISLCHDAYCFINGVCTKLTSEAIEKAGVLHDGMTAYRTGRGCTTLVTAELCFREDCLEHGFPTLQLDEDEEKFFDRIPVEILLAAMRTCGFPDQGYLELKASAMGAKHVDIVTCKGTAYAKFVCGIEQGNPDSPTVSNLVIKMKHDAWMHVADEIRSIFKKQGSNQSGQYLFNSINELDGQVILCRIGYCDDNTKYCYIRDEKDLLYLTVYFLQLAGDLSMVTKIGRKGAKCEIQFFNVSAEFAFKIKACWSTAWSFLHDGPIEEKVPIKIHLKQKEFEKFMELSNFSDLPVDEQVQWNKIISPPAHRHLGLTATLAGDTSASSEKVMNKIKERMINLRISRMHLNAQIKCINMLCSTVHSYVPLQAGYVPADLRNLDKLTVQLIQKSAAMTKSDSCHRIFLPQQVGGMGFLSFVEVDLINVARELEIISNGHLIDAKSFRTRIEALDTYENSEVRLATNHARNAIWKLAQFGIHLRDGREEELNYVLSEIETSRVKYASIGDNKYKDGNTWGIGLGKVTNLDLAFGGPIHKALQLIDSHDWNVNASLRSQIDKECPIQTKTLLSFHRKIKMNRFREITSLLSCWEWYNKNGKATSVPTQYPELWTYVDIGEYIRNIHPLDYLNLSSKELVQLARKRLQLPWLKYDMETWPASYRDNSLAYSWEQQLLEDILNSGSPLVIATDGSLATHLHSSNDCSSALVICAFDITSNESIRNGSWENRPTKPLYSRICDNPASLGNSKSDIATGEGMAYLMQEMLIPGALPRVTITDSEVTRNVALKVRDCFDSNVDRTTVRELLGGIGKFIVSEILDLLNNTTLQEMDRIDGRLLENRILIEELRERHKDFLDISSEWIGKSNGDINAWPPRYHDYHQTHAILKVNSHQLNSEGSAIKDNPRYPTLVPNLCMLSANHHADVAADVVRSEHFRKENAFSKQKLRVRLPPSILTYSLTLNGRSIERHVSTALQDAFTREKIKRLKTKGTQGLLWRFYEDTTLQWNEIMIHKGWFRWLLGYTRSHTRSLYKFLTYRDGCVKKFNETISTHESSTLICKPISENEKTNEVIRILSGCMWCPNFIESTRQKGNRKHAANTCENYKLKYFRDNIDNKVENKLRIFFTKLNSYYSFTFMTNILNGIEKICSQIHHSNACRLKKPTNPTSNMYITSIHLFAKYGFSSWTNALSQDNVPSSCFIFSEIFGIRLQNRNADFKDEELGLLDAFWLGLVPKQIDLYIQKSCKEGAHTGLDHDNRIYCKEELLQSWREIKGYILGRAVGIHRIISTISNETEKENQKKYNIPGRRRKIRKKNPAKDSPTVVSPLKRVISKDVMLDLESPSKKAKTDPKEEKITNYALCFGLTCSIDGRIWCEESNFRQNKIKSSLKQCQRCYRYQASLNQAQKALHTMVTHNDSEQQIHFLNTFNSYQDKKINYPSLMQLLNQCAQIKEPNGTDYTNKVKVTDRQKLVIKSILVALRVCTTSKSQAHIILSKAAAYITKAITNRNATIKLCRPKQTKTNASLTTQAGTTSLSSSTKLKVALVNLESPLQPTLPTTTDVGTEITPEVLQLCNITKNAGHFMAGQAMLFAIEVLRHTSLSSIYIANSDATDIATRWSMSDGWPYFARMFNSRIVLTRKPDGLYLIPLFTGHTNAGHWYLLAIQKTKAFYDAHIIDSCNFSHDDSEIHRKIKAAFAPNRGRFKWTTCSTFQQTETECGSRVIVAMRTCCQGAARELPMIDLISDASLSAVSVGDYNASDIREAAIGVIRQYRGSMRSHRINSREAMGAGGRSKRGRAPKRYRESQRMKGGIQKLQTKMK